MAGLPRLREKDMSKAVVSEPLTEASPRFQARAAGFFWLMTALSGTFAMSGDRLIVYGDAAATAANILAHEALYRWTSTANLVAGVCYLAATVLVYFLLKPVNRSLSLLAGFFSLAGCSIAGLGLAFRLAPLVVLGGAQYMSAFTAEQSHALSLAFLRLNAQTFYVSHVFFGLHCFLVGYLILRSAFLPRVVGVLMLFAGLGWLTMSFASLLSPPLARSLFPYIIAPGVLGEVSLSLWLLVKGVDVRRWEEQASAAGHLRQ